MLGLANCAAAAGATAHQNGRSWALLPPRSAFSRVVRNYLPGLDTVMAAEKRKRGVSKQPLSLRPRVLCATGDGDAS